MPHSTLVPGSLLVGLLHYSIILAYQLQALRLAHICCGATLVHQPACPFHVCERYVWLSLQVSWQMLQPSRTACC